MTTGLIVHQSWPNLSPILVPNMVLSDISDYLKNYLISEKPKTVINTKPV